MNDNRYLLPALSAIALAVLFPAYWIEVFWSMEQSDGKSLYRDLSGLNLADISFLLIGVLMLYVYFSLKHFLNERHAFTKADIPILLIMVSAGLFVFGLLAIDVFMQFFGDQLNLSWHKGILTANTSALVVFSIIFGALDIVLGVILFTKAREFSGVLTAFAILTIAQGIFEVTVVFSLLTIVIYPIALIMLAFLFLRQPEELEIV